MEKEGEGGERGFQRELRESVKKQKMTGGWRDVAGFAMFKYYHNNF